MGRHVVVLDYGSGNIRSAQRALARVGAEVAVTDDPAAALRADGLVVPGVGAFAACMSQLHAVGGPDVIRARLAALAPVLGVCVGMQVLFEGGEEHGEHTDGLGLLPGLVRQLPAAVLPHMGWNTVEPAPGSALFAGIGEGTRFYFVHSYAAFPGPDTGPVGLTNHGAPFISAIERGPLAATQFHPEKSGDAGAQLLENWVRSL